jgi:hypothetical protein
MGTGLGKTQKEILRILAEAAPEYPCQTIGQLADDPSWLGATHRQLRTAVRALERRGLVVVTKEHLGWSGQGQYGPVHSWYENIDDPGGDRVRYEGSYWGIPQPGDDVVEQLKPRPDGTRKIRGTPVRYRRKFHSEPGGMPRAGLLVWLPERRAAWLEGHIKSVREICAMLGVKPNIDERVAELERLTGDEL